MIQHCNIINFVISFLTGYLKMDFSTSDLKNSRQYDYYKDWLILRLL